MAAVTMMVRTGMFYLSHLSPQGWLGALLVVMTLGVVCMRGFGSRSNY